MAVEKMFFVNIAGPMKQLDEFVINSIVPHEIQLVKAFSILDSVKGLSPFNEVNPYDATLKKMDELLRYSDMSFDTLDHISNQRIDIVKVESQLDLFNDQITQLKEKRELLQAKRDKKDQIRKQIIPIQGLDIEVDKLFDFKFIKFRFGKIPKDSYDKLQHYIEDLEVILFKMFEEGEDVFLMYFTPGLIQEKIDSLFASLYFTRIRISGEVKGYPKEALEAITQEITLLDKEIAEADKEIQTFYEEYNEQLSEMYSYINKLDQAFEVRQFAAHSQNAFYLTGWIASSHLDSFKKDLEEAHGVTCIFEEDDAIKKVKPPTKLKNNWFFKPFEMLVGLYGTPSYYEMDPTKFVGITYLIMFGLMFGDIGQGLVIALIGYLVFRKNRSAIGQLAIYLGICSMITGTIYGSVFGNEHFLREIFGEQYFIDAMAPENMALVLGGTIGFGIVIIIIAMIVNLINATKVKNYGRLFFDKNGIVGLVFYLAILYIGFTLVSSFVTDVRLSIVPAVIIIVISLLIILLSHPLQNFIMHKKKVFPDEKVGFFIESTFEVVEVVLAVLSNTISFMRIGAFAMNHVGFSLALQILARMTSGTGSILVLVLGNILIIALEGLIVLIQCLRLEYYELFSRFFEGEGLEFKPFTIIKRAS